MLVLGLSLAGAALLVCAALLALVAQARWTALVSVAAGLLLAASGLLVLSGAAPAVWSLPWPVPGGHLTLRLDALSAFFLVPIGVVGGLGAVYAVGYWTLKEQPQGERSTRAGYALMTAAMALLVLAESGVAFLVAWEVMALAAFFLIASQHELEEVRAAAFLYVVAAHVTALGLWWMFARIEALTGTFGFARLPPGLPSALTVLVGVVAFGVKAGYVPLHVWLPSAHASAPSHVSAMLSGVMLKMGIYGILRVTSLATGPLPVWLGTLVLVLGATSALVGVLFALGQHDLKRLLAYHSIENIGIILMGVGLALLGARLGHPSWVVLGAAGALLHVWNHAFFKSLLFFGAGAVVHAAGTRVIDSLGGLARRLPRTALFFLVGAVAITGLPPLNGFVSELLIYLGLGGAARPGGEAAVALVAPVLAIVGALALACFVKVYGAVFLGEARSEAATQAHEAPWSMLAPMAVLVALCVVIGVAPWSVAPALDRAVGVWAAASGMRSLAPLATLAPLGGLSIFAAVLLGAGGLGIAWQRFRTRARGGVGTWDCGYAAPSARMQYTASSFASTLVDLFRGLLRPEAHVEAPRGVLPAPTRFSTHVPDVVLEGSVLPLARRLARGLGRARPIQSGRVQSYLLYVFVAMLLMLATTLPLAELWEALWSR